MRSEFDPWHLLITGQSGSGKTTLLLRVLARTPATCRFIFDHQGKIGPGLGIATAWTAQECLAQLASGWVCYNPARERPADFDGAFDWFAKFTFAASQKLPGWKLWVCDEIQTFADVSAPHGSRLIFDAGRNWGLHAVCISQAPAEIHHKLRKQFTEVFAMRAFEPSILDRLAAWGFDPERVKRLPQFHWIARNLLSGGQREGRTR